MSATIQNLATAAEVSVRLDQTSLPTRDILLHGYVNASVMPRWLVARVASSRILAFDVDDTLNHGRGKPISEEAAELIYKFVQIEKQIAIISGRTFDEFREIGTLEPLLRRMRERNSQAVIQVYTAGGGEKVFMRCDGSFVHDQNYSAPFSEIESRQILAVLQEADSALNIRHNLRARGISPFIVNYRSLMYQWSPYGKRDESQYAFEGKPKEQSETPPRLTRKQLGEEVVVELGRHGIDDIEAVVSGKTTVSFSRKGMTKERAMLDLLNHGSVAYFGDEVSRKGDKTGNDNVIGEMAVRHQDKLTVISLDQTKGKLPAGSIHVGGVISGTKRVLLDTHSHFESTAQSNDLQVLAIREILTKYDLGAVRDIKPLNAGQGIHTPYYIVDAEKGRFVLRYVRGDLFPNTLEAARFEVAVVNLFRERHIPFAEIMKQSGVDSTVPEDSYIAIGPEKKHHLLYRYIDGEVGSFATMNNARFAEMVTMLARMHRAFDDHAIPFKREYFQRSLFDIAAKASLVEALRDRIARKRQNPSYSYTRGERLVIENAEFIIQQIHRSCENLKEVFSALPILPIHSDYHPPNVIFAGDRIVGVIDLEHMRSEPRIYDLAPMTRLGTECGIFHLENAQAVVLAYNRENKLTPEEVEALPEIFRLKLLDRVCRIVNPGRHFEGRGFDFNGVHEEERSIALIDHNDALFTWYQNLITSIRDLDVRVAHGDFRMVIQDKLRSEKQSATEFRREYLRGLRANKPEEKIELVSLGQFDLTSLLAGGVEVEKVAHRDHGSWTQTGNFFSPSRKGEIEWCRLKYGDRVLFYTDKVVVSQVQGRDIHINIRGNDTEAVKDNAEKALIVVVPDSQNHPREIRMLPASRRDLSRSSMAIQLTDSGFIDRFPELHRLLRYQLVWQDVDGGLRHRELLDALDVRLDRLRQAEARPAELTGEELSSIMHFSYFKSKVIRQMALDVIGKIHDSGRISRAEYLACLRRFIGDDISEDFRVIERSLKNEPSFLREFCHNLFRVDAGPRGDGVKSVALAYAEQGRSKSIYRAAFTMADGRTEKAAISLLRHDPITPRSGLTISQINEAIEVWQKLDRKVPGIPSFGAQAWEIDYRGRDLVSGGVGATECRDTFVNNIAICVHEYTPGETLQSFTQNADNSDRAKREAIDACRELSRLIFTQSHDLLGKGYFMERPTGKKFIINVDDGKIKVSITDPQRLVHYPNEKYLKGMVEKGIA